MAKPIKQNKNIKQPEVKKKVDKKAVPETKGWVKWAFVGVIVLITYIAFIPAQKNNFTNWDDDQYILDNPHLAKPIGEAVSYFFSNIYFSNYHPLTMILYAIEFHSSTPVKGLFSDPAIYHDVSIFIHLLNVMMVFWFIFLLSGRRLEVAAIVALFFGIHPMHVESVAWIAELKDVLYAFFFIGGLISYYKYINGKEKKKINLIVLTFILFVLSGLSKPAAVTFPLILILLDFYNKRKFTINVWMEKIPFFIISLIFGILTIKAQKETAIGSFEAYSILQRLTFLSYGMLEYIYKLFLPINLSALYPYPQLVNGSLPIIFYLTPIIALALFYGVYRSLKYSRLVAFGVLFFIANIILVLQFLSVGVAIISERYTYIPYIGLLFIIGMGFSWIYRNKDPQYSKFKTPSTLLLAVFAITCAYLTSERCKVWFNSDVLWTNEINKFPNNAEGWKNRGGYLVDKSKFDINAGANDFDAALKDFNTSMALNPSDWKNYSNRGHIYAIKKNIDSSLIDYSKSISLNPTNAPAYLNRALDYCMKEKLDSAMLDFDMVIKLKGDDMTLYENRAYAYLRQAKYKESLADYNKYIGNGDKIAPNIYALRGFDNYKLENYQAAINDYSKAIEMNPNFPEAFYIRSQSFLGLDKFKNAMDDALKAQSLGYPVDPIYMNQLRGLQK